MRYLMTLQANLSDDLMVLRGLMFLWGAFMVLGFVDSLADALRYRRQRRRVLMNIASVMFCFLLTIFVSEGDFLARGGVWIAVMLGIFCIMTVGVVMQVVTSIRFRRERIYPGSVKESVDQLLTGVCYYYTDGRIKLHNVKMEEIWRTLTGRALVDGRVLWSTISEGQANLGTCVNGGETPIYILPDGSVRSWKRTRVTADGMELYEVLAADVTEEYGLVRDLEEKKERLRLRGQRLKTLGERIDALNIEKEVLDSKIRVHDEWGRALMAAKAYMEKPDAVNKSEFLSMWEKMISYVEVNDQSSSKEAYEDIFRGAEALGLEITVDGRLPEEYDVRNILIQAMTVSLSNMVKHAGGKKLQVTIERSASVGSEEDSSTTAATGKEKLVFSLRNDGSAPEGEVKEKGGLLNLRKKVEAMGGKMSITSNPQFVLRIELETRAESKPESKEE